MKVAAIKVTTMKNPSSTSFVKPPGKRLVPQNPDCFFEKYAYGDKECSDPAEATFLVVAATNENLPPNVIKQLAKELKNLDETPPEGIKVGVNDDDFTTIFADIDGP
ncbi:hypothetical protein KSS87_012143, partial [Heliosperma pusillum]